MDASATYMEAATWENVPSDMCDQHKLNQPVCWRSLIRVFVVRMKKLYMLSYPITKTRLFNYTENFTTKNWKFSDKNSNIFHSSAQNIDCGYPLEPPRQGASNEYPQSLFLSRNKKNNVYPCKPPFYYIKVGFKGINII